MSRTQKRLFCSSEKENKTLNSLCGCCSFMHCVFFHTDLLFPCLKALDCLNLLGLANSTSFWCMWYTLTPSAYIKRSCKMSHPFRMTKQQGTLWKASCTLLYVQLSHIREQQIIQSFVSLFLPKKVEFTYVDIYLSICCTCFRSLLAMVVIEGILRREAGNCE